MPLPKEFNMHRINDYILGKRSGLTKAQKLIAYHCIHLDYGRRKGGKFWKGAAAVGADTDCARRTVYRTWEEMERRGWITDTGKRNGRAKVWRIEYVALWNESHLMCNEVTSDGPSVPPDVPSVPTNPPKKASEMKPPNEPTPSVSASSSLQEPTTAKPRRSDFEGWGDPPDSGARYIGDIQYKASLSLWKKNQVQGSVQIPCN